MAQRPVLITLTILRISSTFAATPSEPQWCYAIAHKLQLSTSRVQKLLDRLTAAGWLTWENEKVRERIKRPPRRYFRITELGLEQTRKALADLKLR